MTREEFDFIQVIGTSPECVVWKAQHNKTRKYIAIKQFSKLKVYEKKLLKYIISERDILISLHSQFMTNLYCSFQDKEYLYLVIDYCSGGDLQCYRSNNHKLLFSEEEAKFILGCTLIALEYIHSNGIIHRDIKPENLFFDNKGYIVVGDFGLAKKIGEGFLINSRSGTPGYLAPEVIRNSTTYYESDLFSFGVIAYELVFGTRPFKSRTKEALALEFKEKTIEVSKKDIPRGYHAEDTCDFINRLLCYDHEKRLGRRGVSEVIEHPFFKNFNWSALRNRKVISTFIPKFGDYSIDYQYLKKKSSKNFKGLLEKEDKLDDPKFQKEFEDFEYFDYGFAVMNSLSARKRKFKIVKDCNSFRLLGTHHRYNSLEANKPKPACPYPKKTSNSSTTINKLLNESKDYPMESYDLSDPRKVAPVKGLQTFSEIKKASTKKFTVTSSPERRMNIFKSAAKSKSSKKILNLFNQASQSSSKIISSSTKDGSEILPIIPSASAQKSNEKCFMKLRKFTSQKNIFSSILGKKVGVKVSQ